MTRDVAPAAVLAPRARAVPPVVPLAAPPAVPLAAASGDVAPCSVAAVFDAAHYVDQNPDVAASGADPLRHFEREGWREGRSPNPYFDLAYYRDQAPEAFADPEGPVRHYLRQGEADGDRPSPWFDPAWYRARHGLSPGTNALAHFLAHRREASPNPGFDAAFYLGAYPDVARAGVDPFLHFRDRGRAEGRLPRPEPDFLRDGGLFDENFYLVQNADVREAGLDPVVHFLGSGWTERRYPNPFFNPDWYAASQPLGGLNPLVHYALIGEPAGARPSLAFDPAWYRRTYAIAPHQSPLAHYLAHRREQRFSPLPLFDIEFYLASYGGRIGPNRDPFTHYLLAGAPRDLDPNPFFRTGPYRRRHMAADAEARATAPGRAELDNPLLHFLANFVLEGSRHGSPG
jgi:hypothetical protein